MTAGTHPPQKTVEAVVPEVDAGASFRAVRSGTCRLRKTAPAVKQGRLHPEMDKAATLPYCFLILLA